MSESVSNFGIFSNFDFQKTHLNIQKSTATTLFATHHRFEQREHFLKNFLEGDDRSANTGLPLEEQNPVLHHCLRKLPAVLYLASTQNSCTMEWILVFALFTLYLYFKNAK